MSSKKKRSQRRQKTARQKEREKSERRVQKAVRSRAHRPNTLVLTPGEWTQGPLETIPASKLNTLLIDESYQRMEIKHWVNDLINVLANGGAVLNPISVVERKDGSRYIVDGQQRYWAHYHVGKRIAAQIYYVSDMPAERKIFNILNAKRALTSATVAHAWNGPAGDLLRWMNEAEDSPLRDRIAFTPGTHRINATALVRALRSAMCGTAGFSGGRGGVQAMLEQIDAVCLAHPAKARKMAQMLGVLFAKIFDHENTRDRTLRSVVATAFGQAAHRHWWALPVRVAWEQPDPKVLASWRRRDWSKLTPTHAMQWVPVVLAKVLEGWPVEGDWEEVE